MAVSKSPTVSISTLSPHACAQLVDEGVDAIGKVLRDKSEAIRLVLATVLARGHVLVEDVPGVGKTTLARAVARVLGCRFSRIQFTADMLPSDLLGVQVWDGEGKEFIFKKGPLFSDVVLADEINRAPPKTQSAMLEAMAERCVSVDDTTHSLPEVFFVLATQNPVEHHGTYPLPESQLDRFTISLSLGYPGAEHEKVLLSGSTASYDAVDSIPALFDPQKLKDIQRMVDRVVLSEPVAEYLLALVTGTREHPDVVLGCSPRGSMVFAAMARAWAFLQGRGYVLPDDIQYLASWVLSHRLVMGGLPGDRGPALALIQEILEKTPVPR